MLSRFNIEKDSLEKPKQMWEIIDVLKSLELPFNKQVLEYYKNTQGMRWEAIDDIYSLWSISELRQQYAELKLSKKVLYFSDVLIWSYGIYFDIISDDVVRVVADYHKNGTVILANSISEFFSGLNRDWDGTLYPKKSV